MTTEPVALILTGDQEAATELGRSVQPACAYFEVSPQRNLDGMDPTTWIAVAGILAAKLPDVISSIGDLVGRFRVSRIQVGDVIIENPSKAAVAELLEHLSDRADPASRDR